MISVLLATHNGERTLPVTLAGLSAQAGAAPWQLIVVDDGSTDSTPAIIESFAGRLPLQHVTQPRAGKSAALNRALEQVTGDACVFIDDDVELPEDFLVRYERLLEAHPDYAIFGGRIQARWPGSDRPPVWLTGEEEILSAAYGEHPKHLASGPSRMDWIWGANYAVRTDALRQAGPFNINIGPGANQSRQGGELDLNLRLERLGVRAWFSQAPCVGHLIQPNQLCAKWLRARGFAYGRQQFDIAGDRSASTVAGYPRWLLSIWLRAAGAEIAARLSGRTGRACREAWRRGFAAGMLHASRRQ